MTGGATMLAQGLFVPVFFVTVGLRVDLRQALSAPAFVVGLTAVAVLTKAAGAGLGARAGGSAWAEAGTVAAGMIARGEVALVVASLGLKEAIISPDVFTVVVVMTLATTLLTPLLLRLALQAQVRAQSVEKPSANLLAADAPQVSMPSVPEYPEDGVVYAVVPAEMDDG